MKIHARAGLVLVAAALLAGCGRSPTATTSPRAPAADEAQHVDNPGQTPMKDP